MKTSSRNQFKGIIKDIERHTINGIVTIDSNGAIFHSIITLNAIDELGLEVGKEATAVIKSAQILVSNDKNEISARNKIKGKITKINEAKISIDANGDKLSAIITKSQIANMGLKEGMEAYIVVKDTSVLLGNPNMEESCNCASNMIKGTITNIKKGEILSVVSVDSNNGNKFVAEISNDAVERLKIDVGSKTTVFFKALSCLVGIE